MPERAHYCHRFDEIAGPRHSSLLWLPERKAPLALTPHEHRGCRTRKPASPDPPARARFSNLRMHPVSVVGGGIAGRALAARRDPERFRVTIYERREELAPCGDSAGHVAGGPAGTGCVWVSFRTAGRPVRAVLGPGSRHRPCVGVGGARCCARRPCGRPRPPRSGRRSPTGPSRGATGCSGWPDMPAVRPWPCARRCASRWPWRSRRSAPPRCRVRSWAPAQSPKSRKNGGRRAGPSRPPP
jgi:hypothetical protein